MQSAAIFISEAPPASDERGLAYWPADVLLLYRRSSGLPRKHALPRQYRENFPGAPQQSPDAYEETGA
jgi:hypothetical protein